MSNREYLGEFKHSVKARSVYLWGAGMVLDRSYHFLQSLIGSASGIFDRDAGKLPPSMYGVPVLAPDGLMNLDKEKTVFVITCIYVGQIEKELKNLGFKYVFHIFKMYKDSIFNFHPPIAASDNKNIIALKKMLRDKKSIEVLEKIIDLRGRQCCDYREIDEDNQYFCRDVWQMGEEEVFVDAGAFNGDTVAAFKKATNNKYLRIYAFEPDKANYEVIQKNEKNVIVYPYAVWDKSENLSFSDGNKESSAVKECGRTVVEAKPLDLVIDDAVTFIKMDVEGAELKALAGAKNLIQTYRPKLAICIYHKYDDLWEIPFYIKSLMPAYEFSIRHHHRTWFETVLYAEVKSNSKV